MKGRMDVDRLAEARELYRAHCQTTTSIPLFSQAWMLDALAPERWSAAMVRDNSGNIVASWPFTYRRAFGLWVSTAPNLIPRLGPWFDSSMDNDPASSKALSRRHKALGELADQLPAFAHFSQNWNPEVGDWLPMHWRGYHQTTYYTYRVTLDAKADLWSKLDGTVRTEVRKAEDRFGLTTELDATLDRFLDLNDLVFNRQELPVPYKREDVVELTRACSRHARQTVVLATDTQGRDHAGCLVVSDQNCAYYLLGGADPQFRSSGAGYLVLWAAMQSLIGRSPVFDFEGSMLQPIERVFRLFGTSQVPYHSISRTTSLPMRIAFAARV